MTEIDHRSLPIGRFGKPQNECCQIGSQGRIKRRMTVQQPVPHYAIDQIHQQIDVECRIDLVSSLPAFDEACQGSPTLLDKQLPHVATQDFVELSLSHQRPHDISRVGPAQSAKRLSEKQSDVAARCSKPPGRFSRNERQVSGFPGKQISRTARDRRPGETGNSMLPRGHLEVV